MPGPPPTTLEGLRQSLRATLPDDFRFGMVSARLIFRTGVDLTAPISPAHSNDPALLARVLTALQELGYPLGR